MLITVLTAITACLYQAMRLIDYMLLYVTLIT